MVRRVTGWTLGILAMVTAAPLAVAVPADCPLRDAPFSSGSPLIDILLSPAARAVVEQRQPGLLKGLPPMVTNTAAPTFAAILTLHETIGLTGARDVDMPALDRALSRVPVTPADRTARCARYDDDAPALRPSGKRPRILLFEKINGFRDGPSVDAAHAALLAMARRKGWTMLATDKGGAMTPEVLARFDAVVWNNVSGDVLTLSQRRAFRRYVENGGGYVGIHGSAGDPVAFWDWYSDDLVGARFAGHPIAKQFQTATVRVEDRGLLSAGLPREWSMTEEWYSFRNAPRQGAHVIATLDEATYDPVGLAGQSLRMGDHPIAWTRCVGRGRSFYSAIGHRPELYADPNNVRLLENGIAWAAIRTPTGCRSTR